MKLVAVSDASERETRIDFWDSVYGQSALCVSSYKLMRVLFRVQDGLCEERDVEGG